MLSDKILDDEANHQSPEADFLVCLQKLSSFDPGAPLCPDYLSEGKNT